MNPSSNTPTRGVLAWLVIVYLMIMGMVAVGGITRLTGSGLSMTEWHPLMGWIPPLSVADWNHVFDLYKESPEYQKVNHWMDLEHFKQIFFWEYIHRVLGRLIGLVFFLPWVYFVLRKHLRGAWIWKTFIAFALGGAQGLLGWFMVQSGLRDVPEVSHFRLAAHLSLAFCVGSYVLWLAMDIVWPVAQRQSKKLQLWAWGFIGLLSLQIVYGAFMAGKKAGSLFSTFPLFLGQWFPPEAWTFSPWWHNLLDNPSMIHGIHRWMGWVVAFAGLAMAVSLWRSETARRHRMVAMGLGLTVSTQFALGAATVLTVVHLWTAVAHQVMGFILLSFAVATVHALKR